MQILGRNIVSLSMNKFKTNDFT